MLVLTNTYLELATSVKTKLDAIYMTTLTMVANFADEINSINLYCPYQL